LQVTFAQMIVTNFYYSYHGLDSINKIN